MKIILILVHLSFGLSNFLDRFYCSLENIKRVNISEEDKKKYKLDYGDILFCRSSLNKDGIGKASIVPENLSEETIYECHIIKVKLNIETLIPEFFRALTDTTFFRQQIMKNSKTATMTTIGQEGITSINIIIPPKSVQLKFLQIYKLIESLKEKF